MYLGFSFFFKVNFFFFFFGYAKTDSFFLTLSKTSFANSLLNGVLFVHPIMINFSYVACIIVFFFFFINKLKPLIFSNFFFFFKKLSLNFILGSLFLGSFWAQQELNWGGFWSWDPVELASFFFLIFFFFFVHAKSTNFINFNATNFFLIFFFFFFGLRYGYFNSVHTFVVISAQTSQINYYLGFFFFFNYSCARLGVYTIFNFFFSSLFIFFINYAAFIMWVPVVFNILIQFFFVYILKLFLVFFFFFLSFRFNEFSFFFFKKKKIMHALFWILTAIFVFKLNNSFEVSKKCFKDLSFFVFLKDSNAQNLKLMFSFFFESEFFFYSKERSFNSKSFKFSNILTKNLTVRHNLTLNENYSLVLLSLKKNRFFFLINSYFFILYLFAIIKNFKNK